MKKHFITITFMLLSSFLLYAQNTDNTNQKTQTNKTNKNTTQGATNNNNQGASNTTTGQTNTTTSGQTNTTSGQNTTTNGQNAGAGGINDEGGQMTSTGRYAAMGVQRGSLHAKDLRFVMMANSSNMLELQLSQMAAQRATSQAVKDFATMVVQHHTMAGQEMKQLLSSKGAMIPDSAMLSRHKMDMEMLQTMEGANFDKAYMRIMVDGHEEDVDEYEDETTDARDADIRAFTTKMLPTLRQHYTQAIQVRKQL